MYASALTWMLTGKGIEGQHPHIWCRWSMEKINHAVYWLTMRVRNALKVKWGRGVYTVYLKFPHRFTRFFNGQSRGPFSFTFRFSFEELDQWQVRDVSGTSKGGWWYRESYRGICVIQKVLQVVFWFEKLFRENLGQGGDIGVVMLAEWLQFP